MKHSRDDLRDDIQSSKTYKKFRRIVKMIQEKFDPLQIEAEVRQLHQSRLARNMGSASKINPKMMMDLNVRELSSRSRIVEIRIGLVEFKVQLEKAIGTLTKFLISEYQVEGLKLKTDRQAYFSRYYRSAQFLLDDVERLIDACDQVVKDIDQAGYGIKIIKECLDMIYVKERSI